MAEGKVLHLEEFRKRIARGGQRLPHTRETERPLPRYEVIRLAAELEGISVGEFVERSAARAAREWAARERDATRRRSRLLRPVE
jgi:hypothetical protein